MQSNSKSVGALIGQNPEPGTLSMREGSGIDWQEPIKSSVIVLKLDF